MRRNNNILKKNPMRSGMALIMAIGFMVIIAGIMAAMLNMTSITSKKTEHMYFTEQAHLLAKGATEYAILAISAHDRNVAGVLNSSCVVSINSQFPNTTPYFDINTTIQYIGLRNTGAAGTTCADNSYIVDPAPANPSFAPESEGMVLIDVYVTSIETTTATQTGLNLGQIVKYHRRTLQKP